MSGNKLFTIGNLHLLSLLTTILVSRATLWLFWQESWMDGMKQDAWHHSYTGILLLCGAWFSLRSYPKVRAILTGIGLGLWLDEFTTPLCLLNIHIEYWHPLSWGTAIFVTAVYLYWVKSKKIFKNRPE